MNFVLIMTDTQPRSLVGTYGNPAVDTPNLDRLAQTGIRFDRAYTACPLCTPARASIFSGLYPQVAGPYCNNVAPHANTALMGTIFDYYGFDVAYTGKWHLDGTGYFGDGQAGGGFPQSWWYDGHCYLNDLTRDMARAYRTCRTAEDLRKHGFTKETIWGHHVADRAVDYLEQTGDRPFLLVVSFDEPHGPFVAPPEYWEKFSGQEIPCPANYNAEITGKPRLLQLQRRENGDVSWDKYAGSSQVRRFLGCNSYVDREIGRVIDAVVRLHGSDTVIIYTSDHGDQMRAHGLVSKGPMMYEETCNIPLIIRMPDGPAGVVSESLTSHLDLIPTMLDLSGIERPEALHGVSIAPVLREPETRVREAAMVSFHRFAINHDSNGEFYPIRCATDGRFKLVINLFETDELYDLHTDSHELENRIDDPKTAPDRDRLHDWLLEEMDRARDPFRSFRWGDRPWRTVREPFYHYGVQSRPRPRPRPQGFPFQTTAAEL